MRASRLMHFENWLFPRRMLAAAAILACGFYLTFIPLLMVHDAQLRDGTGQLMGHDFAQFWVAGRLANTEGSAAPWQADRFQKAMQATFANLEPQQALRFHYPPPALLVLSPLTRLPLGLAYPVMTLAGISFLCVALWRVIPDWRMLVFTASAPLFFSALLYGQWSFWLAGLMTYALSPLARGSTPHAFASACFLIKPPLGILLPLGFVLSPNGGRALLWAIVMTCGILLATTLIFGMESWTSYLAALPDSRQMLMLGIDQFLHHSTTLGSFLRILGVSPTSAQTIQIGMTMCVAILVAVILRSAARNDLKAASLAAGTVLAAPYFMNYDLTLLIPAAAFFIRDAMQHGFRTGDRLLLTVAATLPIIVSDVQESVGLPLGLSIGLAVFGLVARRAIRSAAENQRSAERNEDETRRMVPAQRFVQHEH